MPTDRREAAASRPWFMVLLGLALACAVFALHGRTKGHEFLAAEAPSSLHPFSIEALAVKDLGHFAALPRADGDQPLARVAHRFSLLAFGMDAAAHARVGAGVHALTSLVLFLALRRFVPTGLAAFVAIAFGVSPYAVDSVQWISMRGRLLAGFFCALGFWARASLEGERKRASTSLGALALALLSHPLAAALPCAYWLVDRAQGRKERSLWLALGLAALGLLWAWSGSPPSFEGRPIVILEAVLPAAIIGWLLARRGKSRAASFIVAGLLWSGVSTTVGAVLPYEGAADTRSLYLALPGLLLAVGALGPLVAPRLGPARPMVPVLAVMLLTLSALETNQRLPRWRSTRALAEALLEENPHSVRGHRLRGIDLVTRGKLSSAQQAFESASESTENGDARSLVGIGLIEGRRGAQRSAEMRSAFERALELAPRDAIGHLRYGELLRRSENRADLEGAAEHLGRATELAPYFPRAHTRQAVVLTLLDRRAEARAAAQRALAIDADAREGHLALGMLAELESQPTEARAHYRRALAIEPDYAEALANLGKLQFDARELDDALETLSRAYYLHPEHAAAIFYLAQVHHARGEAEQALRLFDAMLLTNPGFMRALVATGELLLELERFEEARDRASRALTINSGHPAARRVFEAAQTALGDWSE